MFKNNPITQLFNIKYPIIQAGMVWCSGWKLAAAASLNGALGLIGAGSMSSELLEHHIRRFKEACSEPFGVNVPLLYTHTPDIIKVIIKEKVPVVFTSAGNPALYTYKLKDEGIKVVHVVSSTKFAIKAENAGVDAIVCEGFEAGGHNGREETTTFCLTPSVRNAVKCPLIVAGGIYSGDSMLAALILGGDGVQIGSRFAATQESSAHINFKNQIINTKEGETHLTLKSLTPVRLIKNEFYNKITQMQIEGKTPEELKAFLGKGRARKGMLEGDLVYGELEIGQVASLIDDLPTTKEVIEKIIFEYEEAKNKIMDLYSRF